MEEGINNKFYSSKNRDKLEQVERELRDRIAQLSKGRGYAQRLSRPSATSSPSQKKQVTGKVYADVDRPGQPSRSSLLTTEELREDSEAKVQLVEAESLLFQMSPPAKRGSPSKPKQVLRDFERELGSVRDRKPLLSKLPTPRQPLSARDRSQAKAPTLKQSSSSPSLRQAEFFNNRPLCIEDAEFAPIQEQDPSFEQTQKLAGISAVN